MNSLTRTAPLSRLASVILVTMLLTLASAHASVGTLYLKNNGDYAGHVWVDGTYQGSVPGGQTRYTVSDGFLTPVGGSAGGWSASGDIQVVVAWTDGKDNNWYAELTVSGGSGSDARVWFGGPLALNDSDRENAGKIIPGSSGNGPVDLLKGKEAVRTEGEKKSEEKPPTSATTQATNQPAKDVKPKPTWRTGYIAGNKAKNGSFKNSIGMELVWLEKASDQGGYWVGKYEVTQSEYEKVTGGNPAEFQGARRPVEKVSWNEAVDFCAKLTGLDSKAGKLPKGFAYALPAEKQWEYFVADATLEDAVTSQDGERSSTENVGSKGSNKFGLYDVRGNVWEWCADWWDSEQKYRVLRGASWGFVDPDRLAVSCRLNFTPDFRDRNIGFRVVLVGGGAR